MGTGTMAARMDSGFSFPTPVPRHWAGRDILISIRLLLLPLSTAKLSLFHSPAGSRASPVPGTAEKAAMEEWRGCASDHLREGVRFSAVLGTYISAWCLPWAVCSHQWGQRRLGTGGEGVSSLGMLLPRPILGNPGSTPAVMHVSAEKRDWVLPPYSLVPRIILKDGFQTQTLLPQHGFQSVSPTPQQAL